LWSTPRLGRKCLNLRNLMKTRFADYAGCTQAQRPSYKTSTKIPLIGLLLLFAIPLMANDQQV
jgi:hypothetical protein